MIGTFPYCRTNEAVKWLDDGDTIQHIQDEMYLKKENGTILVSNDNRSWQEFKFPMEVFPSYVEWRSVTNFHYVKDLTEHVDKQTVKYLTPDDKVVSYDDPEADKTKKRWIAGGIL
jgi:hypothetical protein